MGRGGVKLQGGGGEGLEVMQLSRPVYFDHRTPAFAPPPFPPPSLITLHALSLSLSLSLSHTHTHNTHTHSRWLSNTPHTENLSQLSSHLKILSLSLSLSLSPTHTHTRTHLAHLYSQTDTYTHSNVLRQQKMLKIAWPETHPTSTSLSLSFPPPLPPSYPPLHCLSRQVTQLLVSHNKGWAFTFVWSSGNLWFQKMKNTLVITDVKLLLQTAWYNLM